MHIQTWMVGHAVPAARDALKPPGKAPTLMGHAEGTQPRLATAGDSESRMAVPRPG